MTVFRLALSELKRMTGGRLPKLTILAMTLVPLLYGAVYLYANWDPYGNLNQVTAAIVVNDQGTTTTDGKELKVGEQVAQNLVDGKRFNWVVLDSDQNADDGVASGSYSFALKIPQDFSANLASPSNFDSAKQAILKVTTNDANNYLLSTIVDKVTTQVHASVAKQVGETTANQLLTGYGTIHTRISKAADGAQQLSDGANTLRDGIAQLRDGVVQLHAGSTELANGAAQLADGQTKLAAGANQLSGGATQLSNGLSELKNKTAGLPGSAQQLSDGAAQAAAGNAQLNNKVQSAVGSLEQLDKGALQAIKDQLDTLQNSGVITADQRKQIETAMQNSALQKAIAEAKTKIATDAADVQRLADGSQAVANGAATLAAATPALTGAISQANDGAAQLASGAQTLAGAQQQAVAGANKLAAGARSLDDGAGRLDDGSAKLNDGANTLADGANTLATQLAAGVKQIPNPDDAAKANASKVISDPIAVDSLAQTKAANYGAGLAPFFLVLALWVGAFILMQTMRPLTQRALASNAPAWKIAIGGWLPFLTVSAVQAVVLYSVVHFGLGLQPSYPGLTLLLLLLASMAFTALIQGIVALLGSSGKFVVLILLVLQLVASGGTFPWQTTPEPLHVLHQILPMGHVVDGMRILVYGADLSRIVPIILGLVGYALFGLLLSYLAARKHKFWTLKTLQPEIAV